MTRREIVAAKQRIRALHKAEVPTGATAPFGVKRPLRSRRRFGRMRGVTVGTTIIVSRSADRHTQSSDQRLGGS